MITAGLSFSIGGSIFAAILFALLLTLIAIGFYRYTLPPLPRGRRLTLAAMRAISLVCLLLILFEPVVRLARTKLQEPAVAVLIDNSLSMTIKDATGSRLEIIHQFLKAKPFGRLSSTTQPKFFLFSSSLEPISEEQLDTIRFTGEATNLSLTLEELKDHLLKEHVQAAVLLTDGNYTVGKNPLYDAEALGIPVSTIGIGDTNNQKDVLVENVAANSIAYAGTRVPVDVTIKSSGFNGENVEVTVSDGGKLADRSVVKLQEGTKEYPVKLHIEPQEVGVKKYLVSVSQLPGELTEKNNSRSIFIKVLKSKLKMVILGGAPGPDVPAVRQVLSEDEHFTVRSFIQKNPSEYYDQAPSNSMIDSADCLVLVGFPSSATNPNILQKVRDILDQKRKPLLFVNGKQTDYTKLRTLEPYLPFGWSATNSDEMNVFPSIIDREKSHSLVNLEGIVTAETWQQLPPIYTTGSAFRAKPESEVLALVKFQDVVLNSPLVLIRNISGSKSFAITGYGLWRWRLMAQGNTQTENFLSLLMTNAVRWLTTEEDTRTVRILSTKESYTTTEPVEFTGQVYDDQLRPVDNAEVAVDVRQGKESFRVNLNPIGNGRYEGSTEGLAPGDYSFTGQASASGKSHGEDKGKFSIGETNAEFLETRMNKSLLEQIAFRTGGTYYDINGASSIAEDLNRNNFFTPKELIQTSEIELWNWRYLLALLILLFGAEWFIRKKSGML